MKPAQIFYRWSVSLSIAVLFALCTPPTVYGRNVAYLMVYFLEHGHNVYFAVSRDGRTFIDVNGGNPLMTGDTLAEQKGIRDPHLMRGPDGAFYLAMTDLQHRRTALLCTNRREGAPKNDTPSWIFRMILIRVPGSQDAACGRSRQHATSPDCAWPRALSPDRHDSRA